MSRESAFVARLRRHATHPAARGLADDCAVLPAPDGDLVLTHDMLVEGVHYLGTDPPADVAWKLVAVNLSDLAAKGATPLGVLTGHMLGRDEAWDLAFADGLGAALAAFGVPLLGGDTVGASGGPRALGLTAIGTVSPGRAPARSGARAGDGLWVTGRIGAAGLGLAAARAGGEGEAVRAYRRPVPRLTEGRLLGPLVSAMADVSDGLLIDAARMAGASGLALAIDLAAVPVADGYAADDAARLAAATAGEDYELLFAAPVTLTLPEPLVGHVSRIGRFAAGEGLTLTSGARAVPLPASLGYEHG